ncbi:exodeoxyribonuclease VIII, partial [Citrobacter freundii]|nr:exodeoxyribonuclease VIII [Citrobacter freundii]
MSVELKTFPAALFAKDKALKKHPNLKPLVIAVKAPNKGVAESIIFGKLAEIYPAHIDDYFKPKVWEDREGLPG